MTFINTDIGDPIKIITVEPLEIPIPKREKTPTKPPEKTPTPKREKEPVGV